MKSTDEAAHYLREIGFPEDLVDGWSSISRAFLTLGRRALGGHWEGMIISEHLEAIAEAIREVEHDGDALFIEDGDESEGDLLDQLEATEAALSAA